MDEREYPDRRSPDHPTSSHLVQVEYRAHKDEDVRYRAEWAEHNRDTWDS